MKLHHYAIAALVVLLLLLWASTVPAAGKRNFPEKFYQESFCDPIGIMEVRLPDRTRIDCLMEEYAIEFDFADKWAEAIGQALHYASETDRKAMIALIMEKEYDAHYMNILLDTIKKNCIKIDVICIGEPVLCQEFQ